MYYVRALSVRLAQGIQLWTVSRATHVRFLGDAGHFRCYWPWLFLYTLYRCPSRRYKAFHVWSNGKLPDTASPGRTSSDEFYMALPCRDLEPKLHMYHQSTARLHTCILLFSYRLVTNKYIRAFHIIQNIPVHLYVTGHNIGDRHLI